MKMFKRNAIILTVIMFVCVAVYLNWSYNKDNKAADELTPIDSAPEAGYENQSESGLFFEDSESENTKLVSDEVSDYFATTRLTRQQARDAAISTLREAAGIETASQESRDQTLNEIAVMAGWSLAEAEIETLIRAKGFSECVVFLKDDSAIIAVPAPQDGLSVSAVSRITETVLSETELSTEQIKIIEVK